MEVSAEEEDFFSKEGREAIFVVVNNENLEVPEVLHTSEVPTFVQMFEESLNKALYDENLANSCFNNSDDFQERASSPWENHVDPRFEVLE